MMSHVQHHHFVPAICVLSAPRCQFSTKGSTLSLDIILAYHIRSKTSINQQPGIVEIAIVLTTIILAIGIINGLLSFRTFRGKETCSVGCGLYLLTTSIVSIITVVVLTLKFAFLVASQIGSIDSRWFLRIQCTSMDFLLRFLLSTSDWLRCMCCYRASRQCHTRSQIQQNEEQMRG